MLQIRPREDSIRRRRARRPPPDIDDLDAELHRLARGTAAIRLRAGEALEEIAARGLHEELGFSSMGAYALERCERGPRWAEESRSLARRLAERPIARAGVLRGELGWSAAELLARRVEPRDEARWVEVARTSTVRRLRERLISEGSRNGTEETEEDEPTCALSLTLDAHESWLLDSARMLMEAAAGVVTDAEFVEYLLAEGWTSLLHRLSPGEAAEAIAALGTHDALRERTAELRAGLAECRRNVERACEGWFEAAAPLPLEPAPPPTESPASARTLDARVRALCADLAARDLRLGELWDRFRAVDGWRRLGFATEAQYVRERLGVSLSSLKSKRSLARAARRMPELARAVRDGEIGNEAARQIARVATPSTVREWIERARRRTIKHLREDIGVAELVSRYRPDRRPAPAPPSLEEVEEMQRLEAWAKTGGHYSARGARSGQMSGVAPDGLHRVGRVPRRFRVLRATHSFFRELERIHGSSRPRGTAGSFVRFLADSFWQTWRHVVEPGGAYAELHAKNRGTCCSPVCTRTDLHPHHLVYRSHGGNDDPENLMSLCTSCHLVGVHGGNLQVTGPASSPRFVLGDGLIVVEGRERLRAACNA